MSSPKYYESSPKVAKKVITYKVAFFYFLMNFFPRSFKNCPIWSLCSLARATLYQGNRPLNTPAHAVANSRTHCHILRPRVRKL